MYLAGSVREDDDKDVGETWKEGVTEVIVIKGDHFRGGPFNLLPW